MVKRLLLLYVILCVGLTSCFGELHIDTTETKLVVVKKYVEDNQRLLSSDKDNYIVFRNIDTNEYSSQCLFTHDFILYDLNDTLVIIKEKRKRWIFEGEYERSELRKASSI